MKANIETPPLLTKHIFNVLSNVLSSAKFELETVKL